MLKAKIRPAQQPRPKSRRAFSLIEAAIVLAIVGLVIGGIWVAASKVGRERQVSALMSGFSQLYSKMQKLRPLAGNEDVTPAMGLAPANWAPFSSPTDVGFITPDNVRVEARFIAGDIEMTFRWVAAGNHDMCARLGQRIATSLPNVLKDISISVSDDDYFLTPTEAQDFSTMLNRCNHFDVYMQLNLTFSS